MKTNAARLLDTMGIPYELREYDPGDEHLSAEEVARRVGLPPEQVSHREAQVAGRDSALDRPAPPP
ncbi:MAG: hypothetical protein WBY94_03850 [Polyangiaceae bacterium]